MEEHIKKQEYKDALRKINNILEQSDADCYLIEKKVFLLCVQGEIEKASHFLDGMEMVVKKEQDGMYYYLRGMILEIDNKRHQARGALMNGLKRNPNYHPLQVAIKHMDQVD